MISQSQQPQQTLKNLYNETKYLHQKRAQNLFNQLKQLTNNNHESNFLNNVHLPAACQYFRNYVEKHGKGNDVLCSIQEQSVINQQILEELQNQNTVLLDQIQGLERQIQVIKQTRQKYKLEQNDTVARILAYQQKILTKSLNLKTTQQQTPQQYLKSNPSLQFAYEILPNNKIQFSKTYCDLIQHYIKRINQNKRIACDMQNLIKVRVKKCQEIRMKVQAQNKLNLECKRKKQNIDNIYQRCQKLKQNLRNVIKQKAQQIQRRLPQQIQKQVRDIIQKKRNYQLAYHALLQVANKVVQPKFSNPQ